MDGDLLRLSQILEPNLHQIATGSQDIQRAALLATQYLFNHALQSEAAALPHINQLVSTLDPSEAPQTRSKTNGKRKRSPSPQPAAKPMLQNTPLTQLFVDDMNEDQLWAQLDIRAKKVCDVLNLIMEEEPLESEEEGENSSLKGLEPKPSMAILGEGEDEWSDEENEDNDDEESEDTEEEQAETLTGLRDPSSEEDEEEPISPKITLKLHGKRLKPGRHPELDDVFFNLAEFNSEIEAAEAKTSSRGRLGALDEDNSDEEDEEVDYFAPIDESQSAEGVQDKDTHELFYNDFFVPPKRQRSGLPSPKQPGKGKVRFHEEVRVKKIKAKGKGQPVSILYGEDDDEDEDHYEFDFGELDDAGDSEPSDDMDITDTNQGNDDASDISNPESASEGIGRETIDRFKDDLFAEDEEEEDHEDMTTHEKRMAALSQQIVELEAENVAPKEWVLMGEAGSKSRPQNSLLEEDLEFERVTKPVPVVTEEVVHALEDRIKTRIFEGRFDDVVRKRPYEEKPFLPSRLFDLKDTKSTQSLAQIYEDEYVAAQSGAVVGEDRDGRLQKEHEDVEKLWESICYKLDALSNAHFIPKQPKAVISTVSNVPVTTLESALPTTKSATSMLAPEEIYAPAASGFRVRSEMTPSEKKALHNKKRKAKKKTRDLLEKNVDKFAKMKSPKRQKQAALESVGKVGKGVTVVGKKNKELLKKRTKKP